MADTSIGGAPFAVGDGATLLAYTDRTAYTVIARTAKTLTLRRDKAIIDPTWKPEFHPGGFFGHTANNHTATYTYEPDPTGGTVRAHFRPSRKAFFADGMRVSPGRSEFYDRNF